MPAVSMPKSRTSGNLKTGGKLAKMKDDVMRLSETHAENDKIRFEIDAIDLQWKL